MRLTRAAPAALALWACLPSGPAAGQTAAGTGTEVTAQDTFQAPPMPDAPRQFELAARAAWQMWGDEADRGAIDDAPLYGVSLERLLLPYLSIRMSGFYGPTSIADEDASTDVDQWVIDVGVLGRLPIDLLASAGVTPYAGVLGGAVVHDPSDPELITRSQTALGFGAGVEVEVAERIGLHLDWRRLFVQLEDIFDPQNRDGAEARSDRIGGGIFWRF